jgi:hypothetical protein
VLWFVYVYITYSACPLPVVVDSGGNVRKWQRRVVPVDISNGLRRGSQRWSARAAVAVLVGS